MSVRRIKGTFISQLNPWFVDASTGAKLPLEPVAMTVILKFDGIGGVTGRLERRQSSGPLPPYDILGLYSLSRNVALGVYEGQMHLVVNGNTNVTVFIVRRTVDEVNMNHLDVTGGNAEVPVVANGILRRERHSWLEWFVDSFTPSKG